MEDEIVNSNLGDVDHDYVVEPVSKKRKKPVAKTFSVNSKKKKSKEYVSEDRLGITKQQAEEQYIEESLTEDDTSSVSNFDNTVDSDENPSTRKQVHEHAKDRILNVLNRLRTFQSEFDIQGSIPHRKLQEQLDLYLELWTPTNPRDLSEIRTIVMMVLEVNDNDDPDPFRVENLRDEKALIPVVTLRMKFHLEGLIHNDQYQHSSANWKKFQRIMMLITYGCDSYFNDVMFSNRLRNPDLDFNDSSVGVLRYLPRQEEENLKDFTKFLLYCLLKLQTQRLRRFEGFIMKPIYNSKNQYTNAWEKHPDMPSIEDFVWGCVDIDRQFHMFDLMFSKGTHMPEQAIKVLKYIKTSYFPDLCPNRYLSSWDNGIYNVCEDKFFSYDSRNPYFTPTVKKIPDESTTNEAVVELQKLGKKIPQYESLFTALANQIQAEDLSKKIDRTDIGANNCSHEYIPLVFIPQTNVTWKDIKTPAYESILDSQKFSEETKDWNYALMGRGLYWLGDAHNENWQICVMALGTSGTGKSTILKLLRKFFNLANVGVLSNNIEGQWAMHYLIKKFVIIGFEIKSNFRWDPAEFQQAVAGEEMLVMQKYHILFVKTQQYRFKECYGQLMRSPIFMACNEMIHGWSDSGGALSRRIVVFPFRYHVPPNRVDPQLMMKLSREFSLWIQKINKAYRAAAKQFGAKDIWSVLPQELKDASQQSMQSVNSLLDFFAQPNIVLGENLYVSEQEFLEEFKMFCEKKGYNRKIRWNVNFYTPVFETKYIHVETSLKRVPGLKNPVYKTWIVGMNFVRDKPDFDDVPRRDQQM